MSQSEPYDNTHRAFLQALIARPTLTFAEAQPLLALIQTAHNPDRPVLEGDITRADFDHYVHAVNNAISSFDMEIRSTAHQSNRGVEVFALVNTASDALTQLATVHSADEIAFVKRVLDCMFETNNTRRAEVMAVTAYQALELNKVPGDNRRESGAATQQDTQQTQNASITILQAEKVLNLLVSESWFELSTQGFYTLSPRALMELRGWLIDTYNDGDNDSDGSDQGHPHEKIKVCMACREIVTQGQRCPDPAFRCPARLHSHCVGKMWRAQGGREVCPSCKKEWKEPLPVGEKAARRSRQSGGMGGRRSGVSALDGADESD
ncbi:hypothetical protein Q7P35_006449 [Cladosporium inversicolor]